LPALIFLKRFLGHFQGLSAIQGIEIAMATDHLVARSWQIRIRKILVVEIPVWDAGAVLK